MAISGYTEFEFDLPEALLSHLVAVLDSLAPAPLTRDNLTNVPEAQGVYQLLLDGRIVYIGKTDAEAGLRRRLERHAAKIRHRQNLEPSLVSFKAVRIFVFTALDLESQLIKHYTGSRKPAWNNRGFGSNDPGQRRDQTRIKDTNFDALYPIDIDRPLDRDFRTMRTAGEVVSELKRTLPYTFRFETQGRKPAEELVLTEVTIVGETPTAREILTSTVRQLPPGWQATAFLNQVILYKETADDYPSATVIARS